MSAPKGATTLWRVRYWRPGWQLGRAGANVRYFHHKNFALRFADRLESHGGVTPCGPIRYEIERTTPTRWVVVRGEVGTDDDGWTS